MNLDGSNVKQVTTELGYDGGAFFSPDGSKLVFRASRPKTAEEQKNYKALLAKGLVAPSDMEIFVCNLDGSDMKQITTLGKANWAPYFHPSGNKIIFCSNHQSEKGFPFHLYMINMDGTGLEQITFDPMFDSFPMFSPDGKQLAFCSNRFNGGTRDTNIFLAEWVEWAFFCERSGAYWFQFFNTRTRSALDRSAAVFLGENKKRPPEKPKGAFVFISRPLARYKV